MKILIIGNLRIIHTPDGGTVANFVTDQMGAIKRCHPEIKVEYYQINGRNSKWNYIKSLKDIRRLIQELSIDVIHIHHGLSGLFLLFGIRPKQPVVLTMHGGDIQPEQGQKLIVAITHKILKIVDFAITLNERMDNMVKQYCPNTAIIPCSIDLNYFKPLDRKENKIKKIIFGSSPLREVKDYPLFEKTVNILKNKYNYQIETILFDGISKAQVLKHYQNCDMLLLTSFSEGSPGVIKEAMACNLKIVSTNVGDVAVNLKGMKNAAVATTRTPEELAELCDKCFRNTINGLQGREKLIQLGLDDKSITDKLIKIYEKLIDIKLNKHL